MSQTEQVCGVEGYRCEVCDECLKEGYMECSECGETVPNNHCEFVDEEMDVCMCTPCAKAFTEGRMKAIEEWQTKKLAELFGK